MTGVLSLPEGTPSKPAAGAGRQLRSAAMGGVGLAIERQAATGLFQVIIHSFVLSGKTFSYCLGQYW